MDAEVDVAVVGGGLVGAAVAIAAVQAGRRVALLDAGDGAYTKGRFGHDIRTVALSPSSIDVLRGLGVDPAGTAYQSMCVWEELGTARLCFDAREVDKSELGRVVSVGETVSVLWSALRADGRALVCPGYRLESIDGQAPDLLLSGEGGSGRIRARLVVAADGANSTVRRLLNVAARSRPTGHHALATMVRTGREHRGTAYQCFLRTGPVAYLPGPEPRLCSVIWSQPPDAARRLQALDEGAFCDALAGATGECLGAVEAVDLRVVLPLEQLMVDGLNPVPGVLLVGDAARVLHPLAGQGVNLGFEDVAALAPLLASGDLAAPGRFREFARRRRLRARAMTLAMDALQQAYGREDPAVAWLRNVTVSAINRMPGLKAQLVREAMGEGPLARSFR